MNQSWLELANGCATCAALWWSRPDRAIPQICKSEQKQRWNVDSNVWQHLLCGMILINLGRRDDLGWHGWTWKWNRFLQTDRSGAEVHPGKVVFSGSVKPAQTSRLHIPVCLWEVSWNLAPHTEARCNRLFRRLPWLPCSSDLSASPRPANTSLQPFN